MKAFLGLLLLTFSTAYGSEGLRTQIRIKIYEGTEVMIYERNLSALKDCSLGFIQGTSGNKAVSVGACSVDIQTMLKDKKSGLLELKMSGYSAKSLKINTTILANGYNGGGQDGPYFQTELNLSEKSIQQLNVNLGFYSKTPEIAQDYLISIEILKVEKCSTLEECSL